MSEGDLECDSCGFVHEREADIFFCPACSRDICTECVDTHKCDDIYCGYCDGLTDHSTRNCVLPIVN